MTRLYEVYKKIRCERAKRWRSRVWPRWKRPRFPDQSEHGLRAADLSLEFSLPMAHAFVLAAARALGAELIKSDTDFKNIPGVRVL